MAIIIDDVQDALKCFNQVLKGTKAVADAKTVDRIYSKWISRLKVEINKTTKETVNERTAVPK